MLSDDKVPKKLVKRRNPALLERARPTIGVQEVAQKVIYQSSLRKSRLKQRMQRDRVVLAYDPASGVGDFIDMIRSASPLQLVEVERRGVEGRLLKDIATTMDIPSSRLFRMLRVAKATVEKKASKNEIV